MATWPDTLPDTPLLDGYSETRQQEFLRSEMDAGPAKQRRRFSAATYYFNVSYVLDESQLDDLNYFYTIDLYGGSLPFDWIHPRTGDEVQARFMSPISFSVLSGQYYKLNLELEVLP